MKFMLAIGSMLQISRPGCSITMVVARASGRGGRSYLRVRDLLEEAAVHCDSRHCEKWQRRGGHTQLRQLNENRLAVLSAPPVHICITPRHVPL